MIYQTFYNLPPEKRSRIEECAIEEFTRHPYEKTNINRIVEAAGIAKGSFYQYFDTKDDLYAHCMMPVLERVLEARTRSDTVLFYDLLLSLADNPVLGEDTQVRRALGEDHYRFLHTLLQAPRALRNDILLRAVTTLIVPRLREQLPRDSRIRQDIDIDFYAFLIGMSEFIIMEYGNFRGLDVSAMVQHSSEYMMLLYRAILSEE